MSDKLFELNSTYQPAGDQPEAINSILSSFQDGKKIQTLLGATGTGKTFTMANIIQELQVPTLVLSHNKTLAAQLATEFKYFFPNNAVHYFISYFDYYQPESYLPSQDVYIEKEATINAEIEMYRLSTLASLLTRKDVIVVASVSALYGLGSKEYFGKMSFEFKVGERYDFQSIKKKLVDMQYQPVRTKTEPGNFEFKGEMLDIYASTEKILYRLHFNEETLEYIEKKDSLTMSNLGQIDHFLLRPATQFLQDVGDIDTILSKIYKEMNLRKEEFVKQGRLLEANRIEKKVGYDLRVIKENGFVNGIENYSPYFDERKPGVPPNTIFDYFPENMLTIVDESHMTIPQFQAMPSADRSRKTNLIEYGFRLPSAIDHRPLRFNEFCKTLGRGETRRNKDTGKIENLQFGEANDRKTQNGSKAESSKAGMKKIRILLARHGETNQNVMGISGTKDAELSEKGHQQAKKLGQKLKNEKIDFVYTSDTVRTRQTAKYVLKNNKKIKPIEDIRITERGYGSMEGQNEKERMAKNFPNKNFSEVSKICKEFETQESMQNRVRSFFDDIKNKHKDGETVLIVVHNSINKIIKNHLGYGDNGEAQENASFVELFLDLDGEKTQNMDFSDLTSDPSPISSPDKSVSEERGEGLEKLCDTLGKNFVQLCEPKKTQNLVQTSAGTDFIGSKADAFRGKPIVGNTLEYVKAKNGAKTLFVSATPAQYEQSISENLAEQIIRPTGLLEPKTYIYPKSGNYNILFQGKKVKI